jgi:hypothetical protein
MIRSNASTAPVRLGGEERPPSQGALAIDVGGQQTRTTRFPRWCHITQEQAMTATGRSLSPFDPHTKEAFASRALLCTPRPAPASLEDLSALLPARRRRYDEARARWHGELEYLERVPMIYQGRTELLRLLTYNRYRRPPRRGLWVDGPSTSGKTELVQRIAYQLYRDRTDNGKRTHTERGQELVPVVWIDVDGVATLKSLAEDMVDFLNADSTTLSRGRSEPGYRLARAAKKWAVHAETELIVFDDVHHLNNPSAQKDNLGDVLKNLATVIPATIVMIGADLDKRTQLLNEGQSPHQVLTPSVKRNAEVRLHPLPYRTQTDIAEWERVVKGFERSLVLGRDVRGMLSQHAEHLWQLTAGYLGGLHTLTSFAAGMAIDHNDEQITLEILDSVPLDLATQRGWGTQ